MGYVDSSVAQNHHHQTLESMVVGPKSAAEKKARPAEQAALHCPRCDSINTKFCYYNNYSLTQPRYFCKSCRRYWTKGGTLRNVPIGGGCRKNKRSSPSTSSSSSSRRTTHDHPITSSRTGHDLSLAIATLRQKQQQLTNGQDLSIWGNATTPDCNLGTSGELFLEASLLPSFENVYGGMQNGGLGFNVGQEMGPIEGLMMGNTTIASTAATTVKQEGDRDKILWGFPWQNIIGDEFDSAGKINWHSLFNNPLV